MLKENPLQYTALPDSGLYREYRYGFRTRWIHCDSFPEWRSSEGSDDFEIPEFLRENCYQHLINDHPMPPMEPLAFARVLSKANEWSLPHTHQELVTLGLRLEVVNWLVGSANDSDDQCKAVVAVVEWMTRKEVMDALEGSRQLNEVVQEYLVRLNEPRLSPDFEIPEICREIIGRLASMTAYRWPMG